MKKKHPTCPCCKSSVTSHEMHRVFTLMPIDGMPTRVGESAADSFVEIATRFPGLYQWACDACLEKGSARLGNPGKQFFTFKYPWDVAQPYLAYYDKSMTCQTCEKDFVFTKEEQVHWYEELGFVVYSVPVNCKPCRAEIRQKRNLNTELSGLLRDGDPQDVHKLERISEIYHIMGKEEKTRAYKNAAEKLKTR